MKVRGPPPKRGVRWFAMSCSFTFLWRLRLRSIFLAVRVESSHVSKQQNTLVHAFSLHCWAKVVELRVRSVFLFFMWVESSKSLWSNMLIMLPLLTVHNLGAFILNWHLFSRFMGALHWEIAKMRKNTKFLTRNPYRLWSLQLGAQNMSKIGFAFHRKHRILHNKIKP